VTRQRFFFLYGHILIPEIITRQKVESGKNRGLNVLNAESLAAALLYLELGQALTEPRPR
jgi:hypothetical protein